MSAFEELLAIAEWGQPITNEQVVEDPAAKGLEPSATYGQGFEFTTTLAVPDYRRQGTVEATVQLHVLRVKQNSLFLRTNMTWSPSDSEGDHRSLATCKLYRSDAQRLAVAPRPTTLVKPLEDYTEDELEAMRPHMNEELLSARDDEGYDADWMQFYPGCEDDESELFNYIDYHVLDFLGSSSARLRYHCQTILDLRTAGHDVTCMLSAGDIGAIDPAMLGRLLRWIKTQPEIADIT